MPPSRNAVERGRVAPVEEAKQQPEAEDGSDRHHPLHEVGRRGQELQENRRHGQRHEAAAETLRQAARDHVEHLELDQFVERGFTRVGRNHSDSSRDGHDHRAPTKVGRDDKVVALSYDIKWIGTSGRKGAKSRCAGGPGSGRRASHASNARCLTITRAWRAQALSRRWSHSFIDVKQVNKESIMSLLQNSPVGRADVAWLALDERPAPPPRSNRSNQSCTKNERMPPPTLPGRTVLLAGLLVLASRRWPKSTC